MTAGPLVAETLRTWREAERLLEALPPDSNERDIAHQLIADLRREYLELTSGQDASDSRIRATRAAIDRAVAMLSTLAAKGLIPAVDDPDGEIPGGGRGGGPEPAAGGAGASAGGP